MALTRKKFFNLILAAVLILSLASCGTGSNDGETNEPESTGSVGGKRTYKDLVVGYSQIGAESEWRTGNTASIIGAAEELGVELIFEDAQQKQENQVKAIRTFIAQQVDVIGVSPLTESRLGFGLPGSQGCRYSDHFGGSTRRCA